MDLKHSMQSFAYSSQGSFAFFHFLDHTANLESSLVILARIVIISLNLTICKYARPINLYI